VSQKRVNFETV